MQLPKLKNGKWNYLVLAFAFPVLGFLILMMIGGYTPFGQYSMLYSDMYHQYYPFFKAFREALRSGDSLLYTWSVGMGMDYLGLISYYLASPLNLLTVFVPESWMLPFFSLLVPIKLGFASLFFALFLKKMFERDDLSITLFGCFYGMCAWALAYQWNIMWLDTFALLPLVALGTVALLRDKKFVLYTVTLFLSIFSNYYIGLFTCIFVLLLFICYQICRCKSFCRFWADLCRIALFSILAIGMTAILELPALAALQTTQSSVNSFPENFSVNIVSGEAVTAAREAWNAFKDAKEAGEGGLLTLWFNALWKSLPPLLSGMRQVAGNMNGGLVPSFKEGLPNLYCGVGTVILAFLFLTARHVKLRDKLCCVFLLIFFMLSFIIRQLDYIWHGFHFTNMIPYRFSFLFCFVMLYMAYRAFLLHRKFKLWQIIAAGVLTALIILCSEDLQKPVFIAYNAVFFLLYFGVHLYAKWRTPLPKDAEKEQIREFCAARSSRRRNATIVLAAIMAMELILNVVNFGVNFPCTYIGNYPKGTEYATSMIRYMKEREDDNLFYRAETTHTQTLNDGALNGYNGISTFTSSANVKVTEFTKALGLSAKNTYNRYCFEDSSPVANLFLALRYMIERDGQVEDNAYFDTVHHYGNVYLQENNAYLPLGFLAQPELADLEFSTRSISTLQFQNKLFATATGLKSYVLKSVAGKDLTVDGTNIEFISRAASGYTSYTAGTSGGTIKYTYNINQIGLLCLDIDMAAKNSYSVWKNGVQLFSESISLPQTVSVCDVVPGDVVEIQVSCKANEHSNINIRASTVNEKVFREGYDILNASTLKLTEFRNTYIEGIISCNRDGLLYTSIPQDGNWVATVDGKDVETIAVGDAMVGVMLTEGDHTVAFRYENKAFSLGWKISLVCLLILCGITFTVYYPKFKNRKGKYEKKAS